jgi:hypothetical protein
MALQLPPLPKGIGIETDIADLFKRMWQRANDTADAIKLLDKLQARTPMRINPEPLVPDERKQNLRLIPLNVPIMEIHLMSAHFVFNRIPGLFREELREVIDSGARTIAGIAGWILRITIARVLAYLLFAAHAVRMTIKETALVQEILDTGLQLRKELLDLSLRGNNRRITRKVIRQRHDNCTIRAYTRRRRILPPPPYTRGPPPGWI